MTVYANEIPIYKQLREFLEYDKEEEFNIQRFTYKFDQLYPNYEIKEIIEALAHIVVYSPTYYPHRPGNLFSNSFTSMDSGSSSSGKKVTIKSPCITLEILKSFNSEVKDVTLLIYFLCQEKYKIDKREDSVMKFLIMEMWKQFLIKKDIKNTTLSDFIEFLCLYLGFTTKLNSTILEIDVSYLIVIDCNDELVLQAKAESQEYFLKLRNYAVYYKDYEKSLLDKEFHINERDRRSEISIESNHDDDEMIPIFIDTLNAESLEDVNNKIYKEYMLNYKNIKNFPPYVAFERVKAHKFMLYDNSNEDQAFSYIVEEENEELKSQYNQYSVFRNIDKLRLVKHSLENAINFKNVKAHNFIKSYIFDRNFEGYKEVLDSFSIKSSLSCNSHETRRKVHIIRNLYGEKISFHMLFQIHAYKWILFPTVLGIIYYFTNQIYTFIFRKDIEESSLNVNLPKIRSLNFIDLFSFFVCFCMAMWATLMRNIWIQKEKFHAYIWGTDCLSVHEPQRVEFMPDSKPQRIIFDYVESKQNKRTRCLKTTFSYIVSFIILFLSLGLTYILNYWKYLETKGGSLPDTYIPYIVGFLSGAQIIVISKIYRFIAYKLNVWENHEKDSKFEKQLATKYFIIEFFNNFTSLFYIAFFKDTFEQCIKDDCYYELEIQVYAQMVSMILVDMLFLVYSNYILKIHKNSFIESNKQSIENLPEKDRNFTLSNIGEISGVGRTLDPSFVIAGQIYKPKFEIIDLILEEQKCLIVFTYVCFLTVSCPLVPLIAAFVLISDQYFFINLITRHTRTMPIKQAIGLEIFSGIFTLLYVLGMLTNLATVLFTSPHLKYRSFEFRMTLFIIFENLILFSMNIVNWNILPKWFNNHLLITKELYEKKFYNVDEHQMKHNNYIELGYNKIE